MKNAVKPLEMYRSFNNEEGRKLSMIVADGSPEYWGVVCAVLEFHETVDLIGRAANFEEAIQLAVVLKPDLILMDLEMPAAELAIGAIILSETFFQTTVVGMSGIDEISLHAPSFILSVSAIIHKALIRQEFGPVLQALYGWFDRGRPIRPEFSNEKRPELRERNRQATDASEFIIRPDGM